MLKATLMSRGCLSFAVLAAAMLSPARGLAPDLAAQQAPATADTTPGVSVEGVVVDHESGRPLQGAAVYVGAGGHGTPAGGVRVTDVDGRFSFPDVLPGSYPLRVARQGYRTMGDSLRVAGEDIDLLLPLSTEPILLQPIVVTAERSLAEVRAAAARRTSGAGFIVTREEIEARRPQFISELLHRVPGGIVVPSPPYGYQLLLRAQCRPGIWIDGVEVPGVAGLDRLVTPGDVEAVEVYHGLELPVEFGVNACGGVLAWTRRGERNVGGRDGDPGLVQTLIKGAAIVGLMLWVTR